MADYAKLKFKLFDLDVDIEGTEQYVLSIWNYLCANILPIIFKSEKSKFRLEKTPIVPEEGKESRDKDMPMQEQEMKKEEFLLEIITNECCQQCAIKRLSILIALLTTFFF